MVDTVDADESVNAVATTTADKLKKLLPHPSKWSVSGKAMGFNISDLDVPIVDISDIAKHEAAGYLVNVVIGFGLQNSYKPPPATALSETEADIIIKDHGSRSFANQSEDPIEGDGKIDGHVKAPHNITGKTGYGLGDVSDVVIKTTTLNSKTSVVQPGLMPITIEGVASKPGSGAGAIGAVSDTGTAFKVPKPGESTGEGSANAYMDLADAIKDDPSGIMNLVLGMLKDKNLYHPTADSPFFSGGVDEDTATKGLFTIQRTLGKFLTQQENNLSASGTRMTTKEMKRIGASLLQQATGDEDAAMGLLSDPNRGFEASPHEQLGLTGINLKNLRLNALASPTGETIVDSKLDSVAIEIKLQGASGNEEFMTLEQHNSISQRGTEEDPYNGVTHGQLNNFLEPFGNGVLLDALGMLLIAALACVTVIGMGLIIQVIAEACGNTSKTWKTLPPENLELGRHRKFDPGAGTAAVDFFMEDFLRIPNTDYDFGDALGSGMPMMMGFPPMPIGEMEAGLATGAGIMDFAFNLFTSPAYYANYMRTIIMSAQQVVGSFSQMAMGGAGQGFEKFFTSIAKLVNSKVYQFLMISAGVGDAHLKSIHGAPGVGAEAALYQLKGVKLSINPGGESVKIEYDDADATDPNSGKLKTSAVNSLRAVAQARSNVTRWKGSPSKNPLSISTFPTSQVADSRLANLSPRRQLVASRKNVQMMEEALDAEYMPFYFHDLRTHEVISMPAFVVSFDESYAANYTTTNSYGRQDPVRIWGNTERSINLSFKVVAFSEEDFTTMWYTINKFVSMMYPQYSKGITRKLDSGGKKIEFIQPFSQVPAASPLIRIRLGDVLKSNYSNSALKNMFGYSADSELFKVDDKTSKAALENEKKLADALATKIKSIMGAQEQKTINTAIQSGFRRAEFKIGLPVVLEVKEGSALDALKGAFGGGGGEDKALKKVATLDESEKKIIPKPWTILVAKKDGDMSGVDSDMNKDEELTGEFQIIDIAGNVADVKLQGVPTSLFDKPAVQFGAQHRGELLKQVEKDQNYSEDSQDKPFNDAATAFFKSENNAVVRSFESTQGRGLAGFILSMGFDYSEATWSTDPNNRGPKSVGINMSFAPVHDLPVGLDASGRLRSLAYPLGDIIDPYGRDGSNFGEVYDTPHEINDSSYAKTVEALRKAKLGADEKKGSTGPF
tara:strand:+ start:2067 stop:5615 length:3549 start_codon:yes stop_codon:yes gene_type:complete